MSTMDQTVINSYVLLEVNRIKILFLSHDYDDEQKRWFIDSKMHRVKMANDEVELLIFQKLFEELETKNTNLKRI